MIVIGGGIIGAGIAREAARARAAGAAGRAGDFACGHLEPLVEVRPRRPALSQARRSPADPRGCPRARAAAARGPGLVEPIGSCWPTTTGRKPGLAADRRRPRASTTRSGARRTHRRHALDEVTAVWCPHWRTTADRRLQLSGRPDRRRAADAARAQRGEAAGARALNYVRATELIAPGHRVAGSRSATGQPAGRPRCGPACGQRHRRLGRPAARRAGGRARIRPLRGSHLIFAPGGCP